MGYRVKNATADTASTPSIQSGATALSANVKRRSWIIQNLGTNTLYVRFGAGASTSVFNFALSGGAANDDGQGMIYEQTEGVVFTGVISVAGTSPRYVVTEI